MVKNLPANAGDLGSILFVLCQSASRRDSGKEEIVIVTGKEKRQNVMNSPDVVL